jgi:hypothetical protein
MHLMCRVRSMFMDLRDRTVGYFKKTKFFFIILFDLLTLCSHLDFWENFGGSNLILSINLTSKNITGNITLTIVSLFHKY